VCSRMYVVPSLLGILKGGTKSWMKPAETVRSINESRRLLDEARREITENKERAQLRTKHTFSRLPGFFPRHAEVQAIERALEGEPSFTILFGASSVGKVGIPFSDDISLSTPHPECRRPFCEKSFAKIRIMYSTSICASQDSRILRVYIRV
jgi:hypothetical protein